MTFHSTYFRRRWGQESRQGPPRRLQSPCISMKCDVWFRIHSASSAMCHRRRRLSSQRHCVMRPLAIHARITKLIQYEKLVPCCLSDDAAKTSGIFHRSRACIIGRSAMPSAVRQHSAIGIIAAEEDAAWIRRFANEYCRGPTFVKPVVANDGPHWGCAHHSCRTGRHSEWPSKALIFGA